MPILPILCVCKNSDGTIGIPDLLVLNLGKFGPKRDCMMAAVEPSKIRHVVQSSSTAVFKFNKYYTRASQRNFMQKFWSERKSRNQ